MDDRQPHANRRRRTILTILATVLVIAPATAFATNSFTDVKTSDFFHDAVDWMADNEVTAGCNPPANTNYCPNDPVTRAQMAVFLQRLDTQNVFLRPGDVPTTDGGGDADTLNGKDSTAFLGATAKATDADTLDGKDSSAFLPTTGKATDADKLDGKDSSAFLPTTGKATDADKLDGLDSTAFAAIFAEETSADTISITTTCVNYMSVSITVPTGGIVDVRTEANLWISHLYGNQDQAVIYVDDTSAQCSRDGDFQNLHGVPWQYPSGSFEVTVPTSNYFEVAAGTHTFYLNGENGGDGEGLSFWHGRMQATFHPMATTP